MQKSGRLPSWPVSSNNLLILSLLAVLLLVFSLTANNFFTVRGVLNLLVQTSPYTTIAIGSTLVLIVGGIDFSLGAVVALSGIDMMYIAGLSGAPAWVCMIGAIGLGGLVGLLNGFLVTRLRLPSFLATMSVAAIIYGLLNLMVSLAFNAPPPPHPVPDFSGLASASVLRMYSTNAAGTPALIFPGISWIVIIMVIVAVLFQFVTTRTRIGRSFRLVGFNQAAARFSGIRVNRVTRLAYVLAGMLAALSGVLLTSRLGYPPGGAVGYEMVGITCAMIGGASLSGGVGSIGGTVIGSFLLSTLATGLSMMNTSNPALPMLFNGLVVLVAASLDRARNR